MATGAGVKADCGSKKVPGQRIREIISRSPEAGARFWIDGDHSVITGTAPWALRSTGTSSPRPAKAVI